MTAQTGLDIQIRWMIRRDFEKVLVIEQEAFGDSWDEEEFLKHLRQRSIIGMVAEYGQEVVGFMVYQLLSCELFIIRLAVASRFRRQGVGAQLVEKLISKLSKRKRSGIYINVRERNLSAQLFFARQGFNADLVQRGYFDDTGEDAYLMRLKRPDSDP